jgi:hypothetical protein
MRPENLWKNVSFSCLSHAKANAITEGIMRMYGNHKILSVIPAKGEKRFYGSNLLVRAGHFQYVYSCSYQQYPRANSTKNWFLRRPLYMRVR